MDNDPCAPYTCALHELRVSSSRRFEEYLEDLEFSSDLVTFLEGLCDANSCLQWPKVKDSCFFWVRK